MNELTDWFVSWFDSAYYHLLYRHRNEEEAQFFMTNLTRFLNLKQGSSILDLPCGMGRHSLYLNALGFNVSGYDLSKNSINTAKEFENEFLKFKVHDMRIPFEKKYDAIFNLFTSFGYFDKDEDDLKVLNNFKNGLNEGGFAVIDFINVEKAIRNLVPYETKMVDGIQFKIHKKIENDFIVKTIEIEDNGVKHYFFEKVKCIDLTKIKQLLTCVGFKLNHTFGNYNLESFDQKTSDRLILVVQ